MRMLEKSCPNPLKRKAGSKADIRWGVIDLAQEIRTAVPSPHVPNDLGCHFLVLCHRGTRHGAHHRLRAGERAPRGHRHHRLRRGLDRKFDWGRSSIRRDRRPRAHRQTGGGVPSASRARLAGRKNGGYRGGGDAGGDRSDAPVGPPPTPQLPAWWRGDGAVLRGRSGRRPRRATRVTRPGSWGPASMADSAARRAPRARRASGDARGSGRSPRPG